MKMPRKQAKGKEVANRILNFIISNGLKKGDKLPTERELSNMFGVSRLVIREAMSFLKAVNVVESHKGSGSFVKNVRPFLWLTGYDFSLKDLLEARELIDIVIVPMVIERCAPRHLKKLRSILAKYRNAAEKVDMEDLISIDLEFHEVFVSIVGNEVLSSVVKSMTAYMKSKMFHILRRVPCHMGHAHDSYAIHKQLLDALECRSSGMLMLALRKHYDKYREVLCV